MTATVPSQKIKVSHFDDVEYVVKCGKSRSHVLVTTSLQAAKDEAIELSRLYKVPYAVEERKTVFVTKVA